MERLAAPATRPATQAEAAGMPMAFEPEPGMFIDTFARFERLDQRIRHPALPPDGRPRARPLHRGRPIADHLRRWGPRIVNVHIEDMVRGVHEHLMFGEGTMDFPPIFEALARDRLPRGRPRRAQPPQPCRRPGGSHRKSIPQSAAEPVIAPRLMQTRLLL